MVIPYLKMYIVVKDTYPVGISVNSVAHGVLMAEDKWKLDDDYTEWRRYSFRKVTCKADPVLFEKLKQIPDTVIVTESSLNGAETVLILKPREIWPESVKSLKLYV